MSRFFHPYLDQLAERDGLVSPNEPNWYYCPECQRFTPVARPDCDHPTTHCSAYAFVADVPENVNSSIPGAKARILRAFGEDQLSRLEKLLEERQQNEQQCNNYALRLGGSICLRSICIECGLLHAHCCAD